MVLRGKKEAFARAIACGLNQTEAYVEAGYSEKTATQGAARLIKEPDVIERIRELTNEAKIVNNVNHQISEPDPMPESVVGPSHDPKNFLMSLMCDIDADPKLRFEAAKALMPYIHGKIGEQGKKETKEEIAKAASKQGGLTARLSNLRKVK